MSLSIRLPRQVPSTHPPSNYVNGKSWLRVPDPVVECIFWYLDPAALKVVSSINRKWKLIAKDEKFQKRSWALFFRDFPQVKVIDEAVWKRVFSQATLKRFQLSFDGLKPLNSKALKRCLQGFDFSKIAKNAGITILTIPKQLSLRKLMEIAQLPDVGAHATRFQKYSIVDPIGDITIQNTYRIAITNDVLVGNREINTWDQYGRLAKEAGGNIPQVLQIATLAILTYMSSDTTPPIRLLGENRSCTIGSSCCYTICEERKGKISMMVGGFEEEEGLLVSTLVSAFMMGDDCGFAIVKKL